MTKKEKQLIKDLFKLLHSLYIYDFTCEIADEYKRLKELVEKIK